MLTGTQIERYSRQIILPQVGGRGQEKLLSASVAVVGAGDLGAAAALYLAAAGVGRLGIVEADVCCKAESGAAALEALNPDCRVSVLPSQLTPETATEVAREYDIVTAGNAPWDIACRLNAACVALGKPLVWGSAAGFVGHAAAFAGHRTDAPCYRCLHAQPPLASASSHESAALFGMTAGLIGSLQATETIKIVLGLNGTLTGRMVTYDALDLVVREVSVTKDPACVACGVGSQTRVAVG